MNVSTSTDTHRVAQRWKPAKFLCRWLIFEGHAQQPPGIDC